MPFPGSRGDWDAQPEPAEEGLKGAITARGHRRAATSAARKGVLRSRAADSPPPGEMRAKCGRNARRTSDRSTIAVELL